MMGSPEDEKSRRDDERLHSVEISGCKMLKTPVTFAMYDAYCDVAEFERPNDSYWWRAKRPDKPTDRSWGRANRPVINVSYWDAVAYCAWLSSETGWHVRLPTEAEWEYACRAGTTTPFWTGDTINTDQANYNGNKKYGNGDKGAYRDKTTSVDLFHPNPWGLYDMHGNVREWCASKYDHDYGGQELRDASKDRNDQSLRVMKSGAWWDAPKDARSAIRNGTSPNDCSDLNGFRIVRDIE